MAYKKFLVDNTTCSRRFHVMFDDEADNAPRVELRCQQCGVTIYAAENHPPVVLQREENLTKTSALSEMLVDTCAFQDVMSARTIPEYQGKDLYIYPAHAPNRAK